MQLANLISQPAASSGWLARIGTFLAAFLRTAFNPYRPEDHYMRGPGPACAAKKRSRADVTRIVQFAPMSDIRR